MKVSRQGIIEIASHEAIVDMPYRDFKGIWTIGIGHTANAGPPDPSQMPRGRRVPLSEIFRIFAADLATFEKRVNKAVKVPVAQHEFDALTSFDFNTGGIDRATLVRHLNNGDRAKAATAFMNWSKPPEIIDRRTKEMELFRTGRYSSRGKVNVYPADKNGRVLWRRGKTVDASTILDPSVFEGAPEAPLSLRSRDIAHRIHGRCCSFGAEESGYGRRWLVRSYHGSRGEGLSAIQTVGPGRNCRADHYEGQCQSKSA